MLGTVQAHMCSWNIEHRVRNKVLKILDMCKKVKTAVFRGFKQKATHRN